MTDMNETLLRASPWVTAAVRRLADIDGEPFDRAMTRAAAHAERLGALTDLDNALIHALRTDQ